MKAQFFLTRNGILAANDESIVFLTNSGEFVRNCSIDEFDYLTKEVGLNEIIRATRQNAPLFEIPKVSKWHFLTTIEVVCDESNYKWETSNNGGDYRFTTNRDYFVRNLNGKWQFAYIDWMETSADFGYDQISGQFQNDLVTLRLEDCDNHNGYRVWGRRDADGFHPAKSQVVEKLATMSSYEEMLATEFEYIPSRYKDGPLGRILPALSNEKKTEIQATLDGLGWKPEPKDESRRRVGGNKERRK